MKTTYLLVMLGRLSAVAYLLPIEEDGPLEDKFSQGAQIKKNISHMTFYVSRII